MWDRYTTIKYHVIGEMLHYCPPYQWHTGFTDKTCNSENENELVNKLCNRSACFHKHKGNLIKEKSSVLFQYPNPEITYIMKTFQIMIITYKNTFCSTLTVWDRNKCHNLWQYQPAKMDLLIYLIQRIHTNMVLTSGIQCFHGHISVKKTRRC